MHRQKYSKNKKPKLFILLKKYFFLEYDMRKMVDHDTKKTTKKFLKSSNVEIKRMKFCNSKETIDLINVDIEKNIDIL